MTPGTNELAIRDRYYIRASSLAANIPRLVLKKDEAFLIADRRGDCPDVPESEFGFYVAGTRFLCCLELFVHGELPLVLNAAVADDGRQIAVDLTNPDLFHGDEIVLGGRTIRLARRLALEADMLRQTLEIEAFTRAPHELLLAWRFVADFADVFEVRGLARAKRGEVLAPSVNGATARLSYRGRDDVVRHA